MSPKELAQRALDGQQSRCWRCSIDLDLEVGAALAWPQLLIVVCEACLMDVAGTLAELRTRGYASGRPLSVDELRENERQRGRR